MLGLTRPDRSAAPSLAMRGASNARGAMEVVQRRRTTKLQRVQLDGRGKSGAVLRHPPSTWCGGWPGRGSVPTLPQATSKNNKACNTADRGLAALLSFEKAFSMLA